jgi:hypothetical protein
MGTGGEFRWCAYYKEGAYLLFRHSFVFFDRCREEDIE